MHKLLEKLKEEFFAILPPTIFFFVALHLLTFIRVLIAKGSHFQPVSTMSIAIASLIAPIPPRMKPQPPAPSCSPMMWCRTTYAEPGVFGPAKVPIEQ